MRKTLLALVLAVLPMGILIRAADEPMVVAPREPVKPLMREKLSHVQTILEGLVQKDFDVVAATGDGLSRLCDGGEWRPHRDSLYESYRAELRRDSARLAELARLRNLEGATYAYMHVISTCVDCHAHCRDVLRIAEEMPVLRAVPLPPSDQ